MTFEFTIIHQPSEDEPILGLIQERLREALETNLNDTDEEALARMVRINFERQLPTNMDGTSRAILGFSMELADETASLREVVDDFADALITDPISHAVKCEDPLLRAELATRAQQLFALEMKLRRVLTIIYLHAYPTTDPYDLLHEETVQPMAKDKPVISQMKASAENQFFHLTFGQYVGLNQRPAIKDLVSLIRNEDTYEAFRSELLRQPVEHEDDASFLAGLKERMDSIEKMRNAVAHNRRPSQKVTNDYLNALPLVDQALGDYLAALAADWRDSLDDGEMPWDTEAREAVEQVMANADWDDEEHTITLHDSDEPMQSRTVSNREALDEYLREVASIAYYANVPFDGGEAVYECDEDGILENVLSEYEDRLTTFFAVTDEEE